MRWFAVFCVVTLFGACASDTSDEVLALQPTVTTTTAPEPTEPAVPTSVAPTTSQPATTSTVPVPRSTPALLIANDAGLHHVAEEGTVTLLVEGPVSYGVDDTRGGVLFQVDRGRAWPGDHLTIVWWVPAGRSEALDLLVTSLSSQLTLHDAVEVDGDVAVLYTRSDGSAPFETIDRLRWFSLDQRVVTEILTHGAWEEGYGGVHATGDRISFTEYGQIESRCAVVDFAGMPVPVAGMPAVAACEEPDCPWACALSDDGERFGFVRTTAPGYELVVRATDDGDEMLRLAIEPDGGYPTELELAGDVAVVNRRADGAGAATALVAVPGGDGPEWWEAPMRGTARLAGDVAIAGPVANPVAAEIVLRADGLGAVDFGDPVEVALAVLRRVLGPPTTDEVVGPPWPIDSPQPCFSATGYGCEEYFRWVSWDQAGLSAVFLDGPTYRDDGVPHLAAWTATRPAGTGPATAAGIRVGATVAELTTAYGDELLLGTEPNDCTGDWGFSIFTRVVTPGQVRGTLTGPPSQPGAVVQSLEAGQACSC